MDDACEMLRTVWGTTNARTLPISATGSAGMEAAFVNTVHDGDVVVVAVNGLFGQRMCDVAARCGAEVVAVEHEWGQPVDVDRVLVRSPQPRDHRRGPCRDQHRRPVRHRRSRRGQGRRLCSSPTPSRASPASSRADDWGIDVATPGRRSASVSRPAWPPSPSTSAAFERRVEKPQRGTSTSTSSAATSARLRQRGRSHLPPHGPGRDGRLASTPHWRGSSTRVCLPVWARHADAGRCLAEGLEGMGLELFAAEGWRLPELTTVKVPDGVDSAAVRRYLLERTASRSEPGPAPTRAACGGSA